MKNSGLLYKLLIFFVLLSHNICCFAYDNMEFEGLIYGNFYYNTGNTYGLIDLVGYTNVPENLTIPSIVDYKYKINKRKCHVETISNNALKNCTQLKSVKIPSEYIGSGAFENCTSLHSITIHCKNISSKAFSGCTSLDSIYWAGNDAPNIEDDTFEESTYQNAKVYVPWSRINSFKNNEIWSKFKHLKTIYPTANIGVSGKGSVNVDYSGKTMIIANESFVEEGSSALLWIIPSDGYHLASLTVGGVDVTNQVKDNQYFINEVSDSMGIYATFEYTPNTIELSVSGNGYVECIEKQIDAASGYFSTFGKVRNNTSRYGITEGFYLCFRVYPDEGNTISKVLENGTDITSQITNPIDSRNLTQNAKLEIFFKKESQLILFADANVKAICVANWDTDGDGELSIEEAAAVTDVGEVFNNNNTITSFEEFQFFTGLKVIASKAFYNCVNLNKIIIPNSVTSIGSSAFAECSSLTGNQTIPYSVTSIGEFAFYGCSGLTGELTIPNSVTTIGDCTFFGCSGFTGNLTIPNSITKIGDGAFGDCRGFTGNLTIPNSVTSIGESAFNGCCGLTSIKVDSNNSVYDSRNDCNAIIETSSNTLITGCQSTVIPSGVLAIGSHSFSNCSNLTSITIPESVTSIGASAFENCSGLTGNLTIPNSVTSIGGAAFMGCSGLTGNLTIPNSVTTIGNRAFRDCSKINCVLSQIQSPFLIGEDVFENISSDAILQVPKGTKNKYQEFSGWTKHFKEIIEDTNSSTTYSLSITATGNGSVSYNNVVIRGTTNTFEVEEDYSAIIGITADDGFRIKGLKVNSEDVTSSIIEGTYTISGITTNTIVEVIFEAIPTYSVSILAKGYGNVGYDGTVIRNQSQSYSVREGTTISLSLAPDKGYHVAYVKINKIDVTEQIVDDQLIISNISSNTNIEVEFEVTTPTSLNLNIKASGNGFAIYNDSIIRSKTSTFEVPYGEDADVSFMADDGYKIKSIMLNGTDVTSKVRNNQYTIANITVDTSLEVEFEIITYTLTITSKGNGNVNYDEKVIRNQSQNYSVRNGDSITLLLIPDKGYRVASVKVNNIDMTSTITDDKLTLSNVLSNKNIEVEFEVIPPTNYTLTIKSTGNGMATYNGTSVRNQTSMFTVTEGSDITISFIPDNGYRIKSAKVDGQEVTSAISNSQYTFIKIGSDKRLEVEFEEIPPTTYTLSITAKGNGSVGYEDTTTRNKTNTFTVLAGTSIPVTITPDEGYRIKEVKLDGADVTDYVFNNQYTIVNITQNTVLEVEFAEDVTDITFNGVNYKVVSYTDATLNVASGDYGQKLTIPVSLYAKNRQWRVVGVETNALNNCTELAAIEWYPNLKFEGSVSNPNLLLYVSDKQYAGDGIQNVVVNNTAENIVLVDASNGNDFYCPRAFTANHISYEHSYNMQSGYNTCQGWETLVLPFDVTKVLRQGETELIPYNAWIAGSSQRPFWLYSLNELGWKAETSIAANTPYIIGMPNNEMYNPSYNITGKIQFIGTNVQVKVSDNLATGRKGGRTLMPNYQNRTAAQGIYALNVNNQWSQNATSEVEGSVFVSALRNIHPFEAYMTAEGAVASMRMIPIFDDGETTGIININNETTDKHYYSLDGKPLAQPQKGLNLVLMRDGTIRKIVIK